MIEANIVKLKFSHHPFQFLSVIEGNNGSGSTPTQSPDQMIHYQNVEPINLSKVK